MFLSNLFKPSPLKYIGNLDAAFNEEGYRVSSRNPFRSISHFGDWLEDDAHPISREVWVATVGQDIADMIDQHIPIADAVYVSNRKRTILAAVSDLSDDDYHIVC